MPDLLFSTKSLVIARSSTPYFGESESVFFRVEYEGTYLHRGLLIQLFVIDLTSFEWIRIQSCSYEAI